MNRKRAGNINELVVIAKLMEYGEVSIPYGNNARYDCILDKDGELLRIQIKTARGIDENRFVIPAANTIAAGAGKNKRKPYTAEEIDFIASAYRGHVYLFPAGLVTNILTLSFEYPANGMLKPIRIEKEYRIENVWEQG